MRRSAGVPADLFALEFSLVHVLFLKGSCVWNQLGHFSLEFPSFISDQVVRRFRFIPISTLNRLQSAGINLRYGKSSSRRLAHRAEDRIHNRPVVNKLANTSHT